MSGVLYFQQTRLLALTLGLILVAGLAALSSIPRQEDPTLINRFATVLTAYPGAPADRVEALVTRPIEEELREIGEIDTLTSTSRSNISAITLEIAETIADPEPVFSRIRDALDDAAAAFPAGVGDPLFDDDRGPPAYTMLIGVTWTAEGPANRIILNRLAEALETRLGSRPGTELADLYGAADEEIRVTVAPALLATLGLTADAVSQAIAEADAKRPAGTVEAPGASLLVEVAGALDTVARIRAIPLAEDAGGGLVTVGDVAAVERAVAEPPAELAIVRGRDAVVLALRMADGRRVDRWAEGMRAAAADFAEAAPAGIGVEILFDQSRYTDDRLAALMVNLATGAALVLGVLFVTLGWRAALIVGIALPMTSLMALATLNAFAIPIHQMSVTGLIVALGLVVDSAIVMTDAIRQRRAAGMAALAAVREATRHLWLPLASSTATTILAFMPIALMPGAAGEFTGPIAFSVIIALISSYALAMTVVPALAGRFLPAAPATPRGGIATLLACGIVWPGLARLFRRSIRLSVAHPRLSMLAATVPAVLGFVGMTTLPEQFFPPADRDQFRVQLFLADQAPITETRAAVDMADRLITAHSAVRSVDWFLGSSAPKIYYNVTMNQDGVASHAEAQVTVGSLDDAARLIPILQAELDAALPGVRVLVRELLQGPPVDAPVELRVYGPELERLRSLGEAARLRLAAVPGITHVTTDLTGGRPALTVAADEAAARLSGLDLAGIAGQLEAALTGAVGGSVVEGAEEMPVRVRVAGDDRATVPGLASLQLLAPRSVDGATAAPDDLPSVPLSAIAEIVLEPRAGAIARRNGERVNSVVGYVERGVLPDTVLSAFRQVLADDPLDLPSGYRLEIGGDAAERDEAVGNLAGSVGVIATLSVAVLVLTFNAVRFALVVGVVAGLSMGLGLLALTLAGHPFGFVVIVGLLGLVGVAINAAIIILSALKADARAMTGDPARIADIVVDGTSRHIVSTTITTFGGFLPLMLAPGGFWPPFAVTIAGGVALTTVVSFYLVPAAFRLLAPRPRPSDVPASPRLSVAEAVRARP